MPHEIKGQGLYAFITLKDGIEPSEELKKELIAHVRKIIRRAGQNSFAPVCRKTRSGQKSCAASCKIAENQTRSATRPRWPILSGGFVGEGKQ